jgi:hypothetical protein
VVLVVLVAEPLLLVMGLQLPLLEAGQQIPCKVIVVAIQARLVQMFAMAAAAAQAQLAVMYRVRRRLLEVAARVYPVQLQALPLLAAVAVEAETVKQLPVLVVLVVAVTVVQIVL